ncbi:IclR family transcriptional regulator [Verminephrobacter eiseniae]|uniref:IclR family transcriptional regulator n=1 Tax=Verminephrobacter eiseniae TaxID=364317 RepID=UPI0022370072|nr:helix-turn-helix domain-containing protein [Verminephrobacter eiseniae]
MSRHRSSVGLRWPSKRIAALHRLPIQLGMGCAMRLALRSDGQRSLRHLIGDATPGRSGCSGAPCLTRVAGQPSIMDRMVSASRLPAPKRGTQSVDRALALLRLVAARHADGLPLCQLVQASGLERTTVYRLVSALVTAGLLQREPGAAAYRLGNEALALGLAALQRPPLIEQCRPVMKALARRAGEPVFLVARSGDYSHCLHLEEGPRPVCSFAKTVGSLRLLGLGVPSFTLLARMEDAAIAAHYARHAGEYQEHRLTRPKLQRWIAQTREQGYAQITAQGLSGVGLRFALGSCGDAALGFVAPTARIPRSRGPALAALLRQELARL